MIIVIRENGAKSRFILIFQFSTFLNAVTSLFVHRFLKLITEIRKKKVSQAKPKIYDRG